MRSFEFIAVYICPYVSFGRPERGKTGKEKQESSLVVLILDGFAFRQLVITMRLLHIYIIPIFAIEEN